MNIKKSLNNSFFYFIGKVLIKFKYTVFLKIK